MKKFKNDLIYENSPYLLQHAYNPVDWKAWNNNVLEEAKNTNKLLLISVGYSACHWCHVMEHESFEDQEVADIMNAHYISIKVDREERPDIDQVYMQAVQMMTGSGGWPMNIVALPDGRPVWGPSVCPTIILTIIISCTHAARKTIIKWCYKFTIFIFRMKEFGFAIEQISII